MKDLNSEPWMEFAERFAGEMLNHNVTEAVVMTRSKDENRVVTNYYNCDYEMRWAFLGHMMSNLVMDVIEENKGEIRDLLSDDEEEESES